MVPTKVQELWCCLQGIISEEPIYPLIPVLRIDQSDLSWLQELMILNILQIHRSSPIIECKQTKS